MDGNHVWWVDKANRFVIPLLAAAAIWGTIRWANVQSMRAELTQTITDIAAIQKQAAMIIRLQAEANVRQDIITQRIDARLDRIEANWETIKRVLVVDPNEKG